MKLIMKHFPFLFFILFFYSCQKKDSFSFNNSEKVQSLKLKGYNSYESGNYDSAYIYFNTAKAICDKENIDDRIYIQLYLAEINKIKSDFNGIEENVTEAFKISKNSNLNVNLYNLLGNAYEERQNYELAIINYKLSSKYSKNELYKKIIQNNIGVAFLEQKKYTEAIKILKPLLKNDFIKKEASELARVADNLGFTYFKIKNDSLAKKYLLMGLKIRDRLNNDYDKIASYIHLSNFYQDKNPLQSKEFALKALQFARNVNSPDDKLEALDLLIKNPTNNNAINDYQTFYFINDSINKIRQVEKNQFANLKYNTEEETKEKEKEKAKKEFITYLFLAFGVITILVFFLIRSKNKRKLQKSAYETETRISKRLHDELANDVFNTMTFIETQDLQTLKNKENVLHDLESIYNKARSISKQNSEIKTGKDFGTSLNQLLMSYNSKQVNVVVQGSTLVDWEKIKDTKQIEIYRTLTELLVNMKKHSQASLAIIAFKTLEKTIQIQYSDNGKGFEKEKIIKNGLQNVENRIQAINGSITFDSEIHKGLKINIEFPK